MIGLVWAQSTNGVIGVDGGLPWRIPEDMAHFRDLTTGSTVVMGRRTWESLPARFRPLPYRSNVVVSRDPAYRARGAVVHTDLHDALTSAEDVWVVGGGEVYRAALPSASVVVVTEVDVTLPGGTTAPPLRPAWQRAGATGWTTSSSGHRFRIATWRRAEPPRR